MKNSILFEQYTQKQNGKMFVHNPINHAKNGNIKVTVSQPHVLDKNYVLA